MPDTRTIFVLSDIHYAGEAEKERGSTELEIIRNPLLRSMVKAYRYFIWRRDPFAHNHLLDHFLAEIAAADCVIANGDYSCDTAFVGVSDQASCASVGQCLGKLRAQYGDRFRAVIGDHELGKMSLFGGRGGMRLASWHRAQQELGLEPFWTLPVGRYRLVGVTSSVLAYPVFEADSLPIERSEWRRIRDEHLERIRAAFAGLEADQRVVLFCHDPTALPFLWRDATVRSRLGQIEATLIGHLHSNLLLWKSRFLSGMPVISFLGYSIRRMSRALHDARLWRPFRVQLCPSLAGIQLLNDGGYCRLELDPKARRPLRVELRKLRSSLS